MPRNFILDDDSVNAGTDCHRLQIPLTKTDYVMNNVTFIRGFLLNSCETCLGSQLTHSARRDDIIDNFKPITSRTLLFWSYHTRQWAK